VEINVSTVTPCYIYLPIIYKNYERPICTPYSDNFNNSTSGWETGNYSNVQFDYSISPGDSKYFIHNRREGLQIVQAPIMPTNKFSVSVDAYSDTSIGVGQYGLTFGQATNVANIPAYRFLIDPITKQYQLEYGNNAIGWDCVNAPAPCWVTPPPTTTIYIGSMSQPNHLGVECDSTSVKLHINNQLVWQGILTSTPRCFGYVGIVSRATSDNDVKAYFDNFEVSCPFGISSP
jgi:hypothetical protein